SAMLVELPMVTMLPPDSTNFFNCGMVLSSEMRPSMLRYSSGMLSGLGAPKAAPPPPRPPALPRRIAPSVNTSTSNLLFRSPASSAGGYTTSNGNSYCSNSQRVQPEGMEPPYWSNRPMRIGFSFQASPAGALAAA